MHTLERVVILTASGTMLWSVSLSGQNGGTLTGLVIAGDKTPLSHARVAIVGTGLAVVADADGMFRVADVPASSQTLHVRMVGYTPVLMPVSVRDGDVVHVSVVLSPIPLDAVEVAERIARTPELDGFDQRRARGEGRFFAREDIARMQARAITDILRRVPGMQVQPINTVFGANATVRSARNTGGLGARACPVLFYVNGAPFPVPRDATINDFFAPEDIEALEVYNGTSQLPSRFASNANNARCGVIVLWTRVGNVPTGKP